MTAYRGCFGVVRSGVTGGATDIVDEVTEWSFEESAERLDASDIGDCTKKFLSGAKQTTGTVNVWYDDADAGQQDFVVGDAIALELYPRGMGSGMGYFKGQANVDSVSRTGGVDGIVESVFGFSVNGALTATAVP